jgi:hypothetical protein
LMIRSLLVLFLVILGFVFMVCSFVIFILDRFGCFYFICLCFSMEIVII